MNAGRDVERLIATWLVEEAPGTAPDRILESAAERIDQTSQRRFGAAWREPMSISLRGLALAAIVAVVAIGAAFVFFRPAPSGVGTPSPTPGLTDGPVASVPAGPTMAEFKADRDAICTAAATELNPLKERFVGVFDGTITAAQRADWIAALDEFADSYEAMIDDLEGLTPPASIVAGHAANITNFRNMAISVGAVGEYLRTGQDAEARGVDETTDMVNQQILEWEDQYNLLSCP